MLEDREKEILETLSDIPKDDVVLIGGYAVNVYVPPRFSVDCDIVVLRNLEKVKEILSQKGFKEIPTGDTPYKKFHRFEKKDTKSAFDLLVNYVIDRNTGVKVPSKLIEKNSGLRNTVGRISPVRVKLRVAILRYFL